MRIENKIGKNFDSLGKRVLYSYIAAYPKYKPLTEVPEESQNQMYDFMKDVLCAIYEKPELIGIEEQPDGCYKEFELNNSNPELMKAMEKVEGKFVVFIEGLIKLGKYGYIKENEFILPKKEYNISKQTKQKLEVFGISVQQDKESSILISAKYQKLFTAWKLYSGKDDESAQKPSRAIAFVHGKYFGQVYSASEYFGKLLTDTDLLTSLEDFFAKKGFTLSNVDLDKKTRFPYVKWVNEYPKKETASFCAYFNYRKEKQLVFEFKIPGFRQLLDQYCELDDSMKEFVVQRLKTCDGCGYCTQTDKSGKRPRLAMNLTCGTVTNKKCPLFPWFTWTKLNEEDMSKLLRLFELAHC